MINEEEKKAIDELKELCLDVLGESDCLKYENYSPNEIMTLVDIVLNLTQKLQAELENKDKRIKEAYAKANNYLYFNDNADYEVALWEVIRSLRPDLAEKWDNGESPNLEYIEKKQNLNKMCLK